jgi:antirestriction protein ArdC
MDLTAEARHDHAAYIAWWVEVLRGDNRYIVQAASYA